MSSTPSDGTDATQNDTDGRDARAVQASVDAALEILDERDEDRTVGRVVGTAFHVGSAGEHSLESYVRAARRRLGDAGGDDGVLEGDR